jgi:hypothetical protein
VWALVETALWFPSSGGRRLSVHGCGSVHAVVELREDARELHHLTGHYLTDSGDLSAITFSPEPVALAGADDVNSSEGAAGIVPQNPALLRACNARLLASTTSRTVSECALGASMGLSSVARCGAWPRVATAAPRKQR